MDGKGMNADAERMGQEAGAAGAKGYDKTWEKGFRETLSKSGKQAFDAWDKNGRKSGVTYANGLSSRLDDFVKASKKAGQRAADNFTALRLDPGFLDDFS
jgi:hypothetical protein